MTGSTERPLVHRIALETCEPTETAVLEVLAHHFACGVERLPAALRVAIRGALARGMRPLLDELARMSDPARFGPGPIADVLEPERRPESTDLQPVTPSGFPTAPPPPEWEHLKTPVTPVEDYPQIEMSEMDFSDCDTDPAMPRARLSRRPTVQLADTLGRPGKTIPSWPAPPPIPEVLSKHLRAKPKGNR